MTFRPFAVAREALRLDKDRPKVERTRDQLAFLPAALEVAETPVSATPRYLGLSLIVLVVGLVAWSFFGRIDMVATAQGQITPAGQVKAVQSLSPGLVAKIHVGNGDLVNAGDVLVTLDPSEETLSQAEAAHQIIEATISGACFRAGILVIENASRDMQTVIDDFLIRTFSNLFPFSAGIDLESVADGHRLSLFAELNALEQATAAVQHEIVQQSADMSALLAEVEGIRQRLPLLAERELALRGMLEKTLTEHWRWLEANLSLLKARQMLRVGQHRIAEAAASLDGLAARPDAIIADAIASFRQRVVEQDSLVAAGKLAWQKANTWNERRFLRAPATGTVADLAIHTTGGVLSAGDAAMSIVPAGVELRLTGVALNQDVGFLHEQQSVEIKVETFPYTRYGLLHGELVDIAATARIDEELGAVYPISVSLNEQSVLVGDKMIPLAPGMTATAEIKIGDRRVIDFFLSPFKRYQDESLRER